MAGALFLIGLCLPWLADSGINRHRWDYGYFTEGSAYEDLALPDSAAAFYNKALEINPRAPYVNSRLAEIAAKQGDIGHAVDLYRRELEIQPQYAKGWNNLGAILANSGEEDNALVCFNNALSLQPHIGEAARNAARIWGAKGIDAAGSGNWTTARAALVQALFYQPDDLMYRTMLLEARANLGDTTRAIIELDTLLRLHPDYAPARDLAARLGSRP